MLDQNTTTIITTALTIIGTLGGALGGVYFTNRHTAKMEHLRVEQENLKRNNEIIEKIYSDLVLFDELNNQLASDVIWNDVNSFDFIERSKEIYLKFSTLYSLLAMHQPSLKEDLVSLSNIFSEYWKYVGTLYDARKHNQKSEVTDGLLDRINKTRATKYIPTHQKLQKSLEALVK